MNRPSCSRNICAAENSKPIYASPMKRVQQTLAPTLKNKIPKPIIMRNLHEVDFGDWTGLGWEAVREKYGVPSLRLA
ncbi:MAG: histidine phosphatase family protein [Limisphaerales bacterium]